MNSAAQSSTSNTEALATPLIPQEGGDNSHSTPQPTTTNGVGQNAHQADQADIEESSQSIGTGVTTTASTKKSTMSQAVPSHDHHVESSAITFRDVSYAVNIGGKGLKACLSSNGPTTKTLLHNVSGVFKPGEMVALMGPSGAGKSTLLDVLSDRKNAGTLSGKIMINGAPRDELFPRKVGYVEQQDILLGTLTVRELLLYTAELKLDQDRSRQYKVDRVEEIIDALGLKGCADTVIGDRLNRGVSGGQAKRVNIAMEMLAYPSCLFLDEPTSGLDSAISLDVMSSVRRIANEFQSTIVCTIHQPSADVFALFDKLYLLVDGECVYFGPADEAVSFIRDQIGEEMQKGEHDAEYVIRTTGGGTSGEGTQSVEDFVESYRSSALAKQNTEDLDLWEQKDVGKRVQEFDVETGGIDQESHAGKTSGSKYATKPFATSTIFAFFVLVRRYVTSKGRDGNFRKTRVGKNIAMAIILSLVYMDLSRDQSGLSNRLAICFFIPTFIGMSTITFLPGLIEERSLFYRERAGNTYRLASYFWANSFIEIPFSVLSSALFSMMVYWICNLNNDWEHFGFFLLVTTMMFVGSTSLAQMISSISPTQEVAASIAPIALSVFLLFSGFLILRDDIPVYFLPFHYISFFKYGFEALAVNELSGASFGCTGSQLLPVGAGATQQYCEEIAGDKIITMTPDGDCLCPTISGDQRLALLDFQDVDKWANLYIIFGLFSAYRVIAYLAMKFIVHGNR